MGVGDEKVVAGGAGPGGIDLDGVSDDGDDGRRVVRMVVLLPPNDVGVEGVGIDDDVWGKVSKEGGDGFLGFRDKGEGFAEVVPIGGVVDGGPDGGEVGGDFAIEAAEDAINARVPEVAGVGETNLCMGFQRLGKVSGGAIMAVAEASG